MSDHRVESSTAQVPTSLPPLRSPLTSMHAAFGSDVTIEDGCGDRPVLRGSGARSVRPSPIRVGLADVTVLSKIDSGAMGIPRSRRRSSRRVVARIAKDWAMVFAAPGPVADRVTAMQAAVGAAAMVTDVTHLLRRVRARGPLPAGRARAAHVVGPVGARAGGATGAPIADVRAIVRRRERRVPVLEICVAMEFARYAWRVDLRGRRTPGRRARRLGRAPRAGVAL